MPSSSLFTITVLPSALRNPSHVSIHGLHVKLRKELDEGEKDDVVTWPVNKIDTLRHQLMKWVDQKKIKKQSVDWFPLPLLQLFCNTPLIDVEEAQVEKYIGKTLWQAKAAPYQREGVLFLLARKGRGILADEPGLGKSLQVLMLLWYYRMRHIRLGDQTHAWPCLIVCPSTVRFTWIDQIKTWYQFALRDAIRSFIVRHQPEICCKLIMDYVGTEEEDDLASYRTMTIRNGVHFKQMCKKNQDRIKANDIWIVSFDLLRTNKNVYEFFSKQQFANIIIDESQYVKSSQAQRTKVLTTLIHNQPQPGENTALFVSGTPCSRMRHLYAPLHALFPEAFPEFFYKSYYHYRASQRKCPTPMHRPNSFYFAEYFCAGTYKEIYIKGGSKKWMENCNGQSHQTMLHRLLREYVLIQRTKKQVMSQLPPKIRERFVFPLPDGLGFVSQLQVNISSMSRESFLQMYNDLAAIKAALVRPFLSQFLKNEDWNKEDDNDDEDDDGENTAKIHVPPKTLFWAYHHVVLDEIQTVLEENGYMNQYIRIDGSTSIKDRGKFIKNFQENTECRFAILSIRAANTGSNLQAANTSVFFELDWDPHQLTQAEDRCHRRDQKDTVHCHYLICQETIDFLLWALLDDKNVQSSRALQNRIEHFKACIRTWMH